MKLAKTAKSIFVIKDLSWDTTNSSQKKTRSTQLQQEDVKDTIAIDFSS